MSSNLKTFVNPSFLKTVDLDRMARLLQRHAANLRGLDPDSLHQAPETARPVLQAFFAGPEDHYPEGLTADLHRIADLGNEHGLRILLEQAERMGVRLIPPAEIEAEGHRLNPKHVALRTFLDHPRVFDAASDIALLSSHVALSEFAGAEEGIAASVEEAAFFAFRIEAEQLFAADLMGRYCRVGHDGDEDELNIVVTHGAPITTTPVVRDDGESVISFRAAEHAVLAYDAAGGRLKVGGVARKLRQRLAEIFAETLLGRPDFFAGADSQNLYTLRPGEEGGFGFTLDRRFDPGIRDLRIVEIQVDKAEPDTGPDPVEGPWSLVVRDRWNALERPGTVGTGGDRDPLRSSWLSTGPHGGQGGVPDRDSAGADDGRAEATRHRHVQTAALRRPDHRAAAPQWAVPCPVPCRPYCCG